MSRFLTLSLVLLALGLAWGLTIPMARIAVLAGYQPIGLIAWQTTIGALILTAILAVRGGRFPLRRANLGLFVVVALLGTLLPNSFSFRAAAELPAGITAILIALVPMFAMPIALLMGQERFQAVRTTGIVLGALSVGLLVGPEASLPPGTSPLFILVALVAPLCYGLEGNYLAWRGDTGLDPVEVLWGASVLAAAVSVPVALASGTAVSLWRVWGPPEWAILVSALSHTTAYTGYVWLVGRAGAVFAAQVAYVVTGAGVVWAMLLLGESYAPTVWIAFAVMLGGLALVQPRPEVLASQNGA